MLLWEKTWNWKPPPQGLNPVFALPTHKWPEHIASSFWVLLALPSCKLVVVTFLIRSCFESWLRYLDSSVLYVGYLTHTDARHISPLSCSSEFWCMNLSVKEGKKLGKRCRGSSGWASHSVVLLRPLSVGRPDCPVLQEGRREGSAVLIPLFCEMPPTGMPFFGLWVGSKFIPLICVWLWLESHTASQFSDKVLVGMVIFHLGPEKPREVNRRRPLPWRDQYLQLFPQLL